MTPETLALRRRIMTAFAATGAPPEVRDDPALRELEAAHVVAVARDRGTVRVHMAHPFAGHRDGTRVDAGARAWWGSCAWDGLGIVAALGLRARAPGRRARPGRAARAAGPALVRRPAGSRLAAADDGGVAGGARRRG
jgi:hypothetical protein